MVEEEEEEGGRWEEAGPEIELEKRGRESERQRAGFLNAHSQGQSLEPLCAGNSKRLAGCSADNGRRACYGERWPSLSAPSNRPKRHKDTL